MEVKWFYLPFLCQSQTPQDLNSAYQDRIHSESTQFSQYCWQVYVLGLRWVGGGGGVNLFC